MDCLRYSACPLSFRDPLQKSCMTHDIKDPGAGRPVDVLQMPDGALLVSDDQLGALYRISYVAPSVATQSVPSA